jgi:hypothetical protein
VQPHVEAHREVAFDEPPGAADGQTMERATVISASVGLSMK